MAADCLEGEKGVLPVILNFIYSKTSFNLNLVVFHVTYSIPSLCVQLCIERITLHACYLLK